MRRRIALGLAVAFLAVGPGAAREPNISEATPDIKAVSPEPTASGKITPYQVGTASWYGEDFDGKPTASGETYDMFGMTAAHPTLPLGSYVKVTNLRNGRSVVVKVNDRGPIVPGRIIDLSLSAAEALNFKASGIQKVRLDVVQYKQPHQPKLIAYARPVAILP
jgi:rare lipoprotein A